MDYFRAWPPPRTARPWRYAGAGNQRTFNARTVWRVAKIHGDGVLTSDQRQIDKIETFLVEEAHLLDTRQFESWTDLFTEDGTYWAPASIDQENPFDQVSLIYDDREIMDTRIQRLRHPRIHAQDPHTRTSRIVANPVIEEVEEDGLCVVRAKFLIYEYRPGIPAAEERVFAGTSWHRLIRLHDAFRIQQKKVVLANCDARIGAFFIYF
jgi:3-phenylpropionate/cinnamic acid dioxygenase small subunit